MIDANDNDGFRLTSRHVLGMMLGFFGCIIAVNITFVFLALSTWTGLTDHDSYRSGLSWNRTLEADAAQKALGWTADIEAVGTAEDGLTRTVTLVLRDRSGVPVDGLLIAAQARHPVVEAMDTDFALQGVGGGRYVGDVDLPIASDWKLRLIADRAGEPLYRIDTVMVVR